MLDDSSQFLSLVPKTLRLLYSRSTVSRFVASSWACLNVLLLLTDWRRNHKSPASILVAVAGLAEWLNSHCSQIWLDERILNELADQIWAVKRDEWTDFMCGEVRVWPSSGGDGLSAIKP